MLWKSFTFVIILVGIVNAKCPRSCSGHGNCGVTNTCTCNTGFIGVDCSRRSCPTGTPWVSYATATDTARTAAVECSNMGHCNTVTGTCDCRNGFTGAACERKSCWNDCNNHGQCLSMAEAAILKNDRNLVSATTYTSIWDSTMMYGCVCDRGYSGVDCSFRTCPAGDDPLTTGQDNEVQALSCLCNGCSGTFALSFRGSTTTEIATTATASELDAALEQLLTIGSVTVSMNGGSTVCDSDGVSSLITFTSNFGDLPAIVVTSSLSGGTSTIGVQDDGAVATYTGATTTGTKESSICSGRGICDTATGVCTCTTGFNTSDGAGAAGALGDCGYNSVAITACPLVAGITCNGHGSCSGASTYICNCENGWTGFDCSLRTCPTGRPWFAEATGTDTARGAGETECSSAGKCHTGTGECICAPGFSGIACQRIDCANKCSGHGQCYSMASLAPLAEVNGVPQSSLRYGTNVNTVATWDSHMIYGCHCDKLRVSTSAFGDIRSYSSYDCSRIECPSGDDPWTTGQVDEVQTLTCRATGGTFTISFRGEESGEIAYNANAAAVENALESLFSIGQVSVEFAAAATEACTDSITSIVVTFLTNAGDLPPLVIDETSLTGGTVATSVTETTDGTKEDSECNARGLCNTHTGRCDCILDYASSDGTGNVGVRDDCGYVDPYMTHGTI